YEIDTEDPVILTRPFTVRYPMRHDPKYEWWEYACHEGNTIVPNYVTTSRFERANPQPETAAPVQVEADVANALAGRWVGRHRIATIDYDVELEFTKNADGAIVGKLIGTTLQGGKDRQAAQTLHGEGASDELGVPQYAVVELCGRALRGRNDH